MIEPIYNMPSPGDDVVARLGFVAAFIPTFIDIRLDPETGYGLTASLEGLSSAEIVGSSTTTLWGVPADPNHDSLRITPYEALRCSNDPCTAPGGLPRHSDLLPVPFMTNPTNCADAKQLTMTAASYELPDQPRTATTELPAITGCGLLDFRPQISLLPTTRQADSPSGMDVTLSLPQEGLVHPNLLAEANLKKVVTRLPEGMTLNPAAANGLGACSEAQIGLKEEGPPIRFNATQPTCPDSAKVGSAEIKTPLLPEPIQGSLYIASPEANPFHTLLAGYLVAQGQGATIKLAGRFDTDPQTGRITATFDENPQQPFDEVKLHFKVGAHGVLITPPTCDSYGIESKLSPWSATDPENPTPAETVSSTSVFAIDSGPEGGPCPSGQFDPSLEAGATNPLAGRYSPLVLRLTRKDGTGRLAGLSVTLPPGLTGKLAGIPPCPQGAIEAAEARSGLGQGAGETSSPSCPAASQVGTVVAGAGAGPTPFYVDTGRAYLAGPYNGAPLSLVVVAPALAGPFDLGDVVVRAALRVNPETAQVTAVSGLPRILHGIPLDLRDVRVLLDRPGFTLNPTSCEPMSFAGTAGSGQGASAPLEARFQVGGCRGLGFKPKLGLRLFGATRRGSHPKLQATLKARPGDANIARAQVTLPHSEFLDQAHIGTVCTRVQYAAAGGNGAGCPPASAYGHVTAYTPLFDQPLEGPVYLRSSSHNLPDLVAALHGPPSLPIQIEAVGRIDSAKGGIRTSFESIPDAPLSEVILEMEGGKKGLIVNSTNLCAGVHRATANLSAHNGRADKLAPAVRAVKCRKPKRKKQASHHRHGKGKSHRKATHR